MRNRFNGDNHIPPGLPAETETMQKRIEMPNKPRHSLPSNQLFKFLVLFLCVCACFFLFFLSCPPNLALRNCTVSSLFLRDALGRDKQVFPGGVTWVGLAGFVGWVLEERGDERWRRPVSSSFPPLPLCPLAPSPPRSPRPAPPPAPAVLAARGHQGARGVHKGCHPPSLHPFISPSSHPIISPSLCPSIPPSFCPSVPPALLPSLPQGFQSLTMAKI